MGVYTASSVDLPTLLTRARSVPGSVSGSIRRVLVTPAALYYSPVVAACLKMLETGDNAVRSIAASAPG
jgi:hypothetical protein